MNLISEIDQFMSEETISQYVPYKRRKSHAEALLNRAERAFSSARGEYQDILGERIRKLQKILLDYKKEDIAYRRPIGYSSLREKRLKLAQTWLLNLPVYHLDLTTKIVRTRQYLENLRAIAKPPTVEEEETIAKLEKTLLELRGKSQKMILPEPEPPNWELGEPFRHRIPDIGIVGLPPTKEKIEKRPQPPALSRAVAFFKKARKEPLLDEAPLRKAVDEAEKIIKALDSTLAGMNPDSYKYWNNAFNGAKHSIGELVTRWKDQIEYIKRCQRTQRSYLWEKEKRKEEIREYLAKKEEAQKKGKLALDYLKSLQSAVKEAGIVLSISQTIRGRVNTEKQPEALPVSSLISTITELSSLLEKMDSYVSKGDLRVAESKLDDLKREYQIVKSLYDSLQYKKSIEESRKSISSKGITYFRENLPKGVREVLPEKDITKLENLAKTGLNGAKAAISKAIWLVAKRSTKKAREILEKK